MTAWVRLWSDMPNDPKWRVVARRAGRPVSEVMAVFVHMMTNAGAAAERGQLESWSDEDVAIAIDAEPEHVATIREAMQGKVLEGARLAGWERRQPKREDNSADRAKDWRERNKTQKPEQRTQANAGERVETPRVEKSREDNSVPEGTGDKAPAEPLGDEDPKKILFSDGLRWLAKTTGKSESAVRRLIGRMLSDIGGDAHAGVLLGIFRDCKRENKGEPISWIASMIQGRRPRAGPAQETWQETADWFLGNSNGNDRRREDSPDNALELSSSEWSRT